MQTASSRTVGAYLPCMLFCLVAFCVPRRACAQITSDLTLNPWPSGALATTFDRPLVESRGNINGTHIHDEVFWYDSSGRVHLDRNDPNALSIGYRWVTTDFGTSSRLIPRTLDDLGLAVGLHLGDLAGGKISAVLGAGFSSNSLFADPNGIFGVGHLIYERPLNPEDSVVLSVDYAGDSSFLRDIPLPGFAFTHRTDDLTFTIGFPSSSLQWTIAPNLTLQAGYSVPFTANLEVAYKINEEFSVFAGYDNFFNAYSIAHESATARNFFQMRRADVGVRYQTPNFFNVTSIDASLVFGYAFDQEFSRGFDVRGDETFASIANEPFVGIVLRSRF